jgi:hypothetical protein
MNTHKERIYQNPERFVGCNDRKGMTCDCLLAVVFGAPAFWPDLLFLAPKSTTAIFTCDVDETIRDVSFRKRSSLKPEAYIIGLSHMIVKARKENSIQH